MKYKWLNKKENDNVIVFFNGWGMDECVVKHLDFGKHDVIMFYDYNNLETEFDFSLLKSYRIRNLIAWSMGIMTATLFDLKYDNTVAVNGTLKPIDNKFGIPERIYELTIRGFNEQGAEKFIKNMFDKEYQLPPNSRDYENQKSELSALKTYSANTNFKYSKVFISNSDKIIPTKNQTAYWNMEPNLQSGHCPFLQLKKWEELL